MQNQDEVKFRLLFEQNPHAVMLLNLNGFIDCNPATLKMFGCESVEQFCNFHPAQLSPEFQSDSDNENSFQKASIKIELAITEGVQFFEWVHRRYDSGENFIAEVLLSCVFINNEPLLQAIVRDITEQKMMVQKLNEAKRIAEELAKKFRLNNNELSNLLNNSGQGFFSFGADLKIFGEYSQACVELLGKVPTGQDAAQILFPYATGRPKRKLMRSCIADALQAKTPYLAAMFLKLIPVELIVNRKTLKAQYISINTGFMVVLSNISIEVELKKSAELESKRMGMILAAVTDGPEFLATIEDFVSFSKAGPEPWLTLDLSDFYRAIHTFKGSFNQLRFTHVPLALHEVEAMLQEQLFSQNLLGDDSAEWLVSTVFATDWMALLNRDIAIVTSALGDNYFSRGGLITLQLEHARAFEQMANELLSTKKLNLEHEPLLKELTQLRYISLHKELGDFSKLVQQVALQLDKELVPLEINGEDVHLDPDIYRQFLLTLGHVMRNAIDHGIEDPDSRYEKGKNEAGTIRCATSRINNEFELIIQDDGAGINEAALRLRASEQHGTHVDSLTLADLVFADGISSRDKATELSGRGVGMAAVRAEVLRLGGTVTVETVAEEGTRFIFRIPIIKDIAA